jgi:hypothetical protein
MLTHAIVSRVQNLIEDKDYWTSARIKAMINEAKDSIVSHFNIQTKGMMEFQSVVAQQSYALPHDFVDFKFLYWNDNYYLKPENKVSGPDSVYGVRTSDPDETGIPELYFLWGKEGRDELWIWPTFDAVYTVQFWYWRIPPDVVKDNDELLLPREWHSEIVQYCRRQTWFEDGEKGYSPLAFDIWWQSRLQIMQISDNIQNSASSQIEIGNFTDNIPRVDNESGFGFRIQSDDGTYGWNG